MKSFNVVFGVVDVSDDSYVRFEVLDLDEVFSFFFVD